ncbi:MULTISPECIES: preprotein translocase subunit YajC [unclassified Mesorhizobium]|uniref:preprotein translocase subunit YajC n=1 Tax=unclassified Mesorhizobium TaxID=325217 RepID=UPI001129D772|nr:MULTISPECIES: preprotein translocase subunit YajC [unclassified Mesorhizobium]TPK50668.1 preprotein translocase subunit YajC [Mesorhizobium sp. B2-5-2]TPL23715.1 preprotein translocase subunit YajC [Mesorhizobium sp. B2-4-7]TPL26073.1 preprotein translocase subunit YajC [Mesorhizobium sp. B2-4-9]TPL38706.1 preprotein translocase subunit YajC [Mesorhizobium sp. B2-4-5]TPM73857.1 preprotein translocase subunit YajC [Mesorhizobium sp. B2-1-6]
MLQFNLPREVAIGDEVALTSTVMDMLPSGRARVSIPSYDRPYAIDAPPRTHVGDKVVLVGDVTRVDPETNKLSVRIDCGGVVTVDKSAIIRLKKNCAARNG